MSGIVLLFVDMAVIMLAQRYVSSSLVAIVASSTAIWIMLLDAPMWRTNFRSRHTLCGVILGFVGVGLLYAEQVDTGSGTHTHSEYGILLLIGGCISWALGTLYAKYRSSAAEDVNGFAGSAWQMLTASLMFWLCAGFFDDFSFADLSRVPRRSWLALAYLVTFGSFAGLFGLCLAAQSASCHGSGNPCLCQSVVAVALGAGLGGEEVTLVQLAGLAVILTSVMLVNKKTKPNS